MSSIENNSSVVEKDSLSGNFAQNDQFQKIAQETHDKAHIAYDAANYTLKRAGSLFKGSLKTPYKHQYTGFDSNFKTVIGNNLDASNKNLDAAHRTLNLANQLSGNEDLAHEFLRVESANGLPEHYHAGDQNKRELAPSPVMKNEEKLSWSDKLLSFLN